MNVLTTNTCRRLYRKYALHDSIENRDRLFFVVQGHILKAINCLTKRLKPDEKISMSWDVFLLFLADYKKDPKQEIEWVINKAVRKISSRQKYKEKMKKKVEVNKTDEQLEKIAFVDTVAYDDRIIALKEVRNAIPERYHPIFDDAVMSSANGNNGHTTKNKGDWSKRQYFEMKRLIKAFVKYAVGR